jgi:hypothetical protein
VDPYSGFHPLFILPCKWQPIGHGAWCPHRALNLPCRWQRGPGPTLQSAQVNEVVTHLRGNETSRTSRMRGVPLVRKSWS